MIFNKINKSKIKFFCDPDCKNVIPEPYPARKLMPDWYRDYLILQMHRIKTLSLKL